MSVVINVDNLSRVYNYNKKIIYGIDNLTFDVKKGEIFSILGPNGAGKSTTIKVLTTMLLPTSGRVHILGYDVYTEEKKIREHINFMFGGERSLYWRLNAFDNLAYFSDIYKIDYRKQKKLIYYLLELVGLKEVSSRRVESFSKGMKQRLQIARMLLNDPQIVFLDEPSIGLDPVGAYELRKLIKNMANVGKTILLTTHYLSEAEELSDRIAIIKSAKLLSIGNSRELLNLLSSKEKKDILSKKQEKINITLEDIYLKIIGGI